MIDKLPADHFGRKARKCNTCGELKQPQDFHRFKHTGMSCGYQVYNSCKVCEKQRKLENHLKNTYGLTYERFLNMVEEQKGLCYLCGKSHSGKSERLVVDHNHKTGEVRKLLCVTCNVSLAKFENDPTYLNRLKEYLSL